MKKVFTFTSILLFVATITFAQSSKITDNRNYINDLQKDQLYQNQMDDPTQDYFVLPKQNKPSELAYKNRASLQGLDSIIWNDWDESTSQFIANNKEEYYYNYDEQMTHYIYYSWNEDSIRWDLEDKEEFTYDGNGNTTLRISYNYSYSYSQWVYEDKREYTYDANGNRTMNASYEWNLTTNQWDGYYNGKALPSDDYWFTAELIDRDGNIRNRKGHFSLIRR